MPVMGRWFRISRDRDAANDLAQNVFLKAFRQRASFRGDSSLSTWLNTITRNHCFTAIRRRAASPVENEPQPQNPPRDFTVVQPDITAERDQMSRNVLRLMGRTLDPLEPRVMTLHYGYDVPMAAITQQLQLESLRGAKACIVNSRRKLQAVIRRRELNIATIPASIPKPDSWNGRIAA
jgi:RNA polymerase sigma factor (sigma-70 family)